PRTWNAFLLRNVYHSGRFVKYVVSSGLNGSGFIFTRLRVRSRFIRVDGRHNLVGLRTGFYVRLSGLVRSFRLGCRFLLRSLPVCEVRQRLAANDPVEVEVSAVSV